MHHPCKALLITALACGLVFATSDGSPSIWRDGAGHLHVDTLNGSTEVYIDEIPVKATLSSLQAQITELKQQQQMQTSPSTRTCDAYQPENLCPYETEAQMFVSALAKRDSSLRTRLEKYDNETATPYTINFGSGISAKSFVSVVGNFTIIIQGKDGRAIQPKVQNTMTNVIWSPTGTQPPADVLDLQHVTTPEGNDFLMLLQPSQILVYRVDTSSGLSVTLVRTGVIDPSGSFGSWFKASHRLLLVPDSMGGGATVFVLSLTSTSATTSQPQHFYENYNRVDFGVIVEDTVYLNIGSSFYRVQADALSVKEALATPSSLSFRYAYALGQRIVLVASDDSHTVFDTSMGWTEIGEFETSTTVGPPAIAGCLALYPGETIEVYDISKTLPERVATFSGETAMNAASTGNGFVGVHNSNLYYY
eukprot:m.139783 g.139783  ORF g.139783 m.139783 type:complete len:421 (+) comp15957_c0_seq1:280-1542(+)